MNQRLRCALATLTTWALLGLPAQAQSRKLGPETAKSIQEAKLDPAFQTTKLNRIAVLPFANTQQHREAAAIIGGSVQATGAGSCAPGDCPVLQPMRGED
jgi:hypothetical protein